MKKLILIGMVFSGLTIASCTRDTDFASGTNSGNVLTLKYNVAGRANDMTRATTVSPQDGEENVNSLHLLFYTPSTDRSGAFEGYVKLEGPLVMNQNIRVDVSGSGLNATDAYKVLAVANLDQHTGYTGVSVTEWLNKLEGRNENYAYKQLLAYISADQKLEKDKLIMTGETEKAGGGITDMQLTLTRGVVRFDVVNSARTVYDLESVSIWNAFPETSLFGGGLVDYSNGRIQRFYGVINDNDIAAGNGIDSSGDPNGDYYGDIFGGLYSFPSQVINPGDKDDRTTCLIVGLKERGASNAAITYHRINISAEDAMQNLKRNNVYRLTIISVSGDGAASEMEAYAGGVNNVNSKINFWNMDDDGLIQQNGSIILSIPTKRIKLGAEEEERTYDIFAFGGSPGEQIGISTSWDEDAGKYIKVIQSGNSITVSAQALTADGKRTGSIQITYASLTATIAVIQSGTASQYLRVITSNGSGIPAYPGFSGAAMDGGLTVEASSAWTARIFNLSPQNFSFIQAGAYQDMYKSSQLKEDLSIYSFTENTGDTSSNAFVLISLDEDPDNYNSSIVLTQRALGGIAVSPNLAQVEWNGLGVLSTAGGTSNTDFTFGIKTTKDINEKYEEWLAVLDDDTHFEIVSQNWDSDDEDNNTVVIRAKKEAISGGNTAILSIQLKSSSATRVNITLKQAGYTMNINPNTFNIISNKGGETGAITVSSNGTTLVWSATVDATTAASGILAGHAATVIDNTGAELVQSEKYPLNKTFKVKFPKLMYGNHMIGNVTATVTVRLWSGTNEISSRTFTVVQNELTPKNLSILNMNDGYGRIINDSSFGSAYRLMMNTFFSPSGEQIPVYPATTPAVNYIYTPSDIFLPTASSTSITSSVSYIHAPNFNELSNYFMAMENWREGDNGVLVICYDPTSPDGFTNTNSTLSKLGWSRNGNSDNPYNKMTRHDNASQHKIADFILNKGPFGALTSANIIGDNGDGTSSAVNLTSQTASGKIGHGVAILGEDNRSGLVIDPVNRVVYFSEGQYFADGASVINDISVADYPSELSERTKLIANIYAYIVLTAQYGSNFSDLFID